MDADKLHFRRANRATGVTTVTVKWLDVYLMEAVRKNLCTTVHCTTCGAMEFRQGVLGALSVATGKHPRQQFDRESAVEIARALSEVTPHDDSSGPLEEAVRCLLVDLWSGIPLLDRDIEEPLAGTWAGDILRRMKEHHQAREAEERARIEYESSAAVQKRREEKKLLKQKQHKKRLALKQERDRLWREKNLKAD